MEKIEKIHELECVGCGTRFDILNVAPNVLHNEDGSFILNEIPKDYHDLHCPLCFENGEGDNNRLEVHYKDEIAPFPDYECMTPRKQKKGLKALKRYVKTCLK